MRGTLIPEMESFDGTLEKSIVIMDNCSVHHVHAVRDMFDSSGIIYPVYTRDHSTVLFQNGLQNCSGLHLHYEFYTVPNFKNSIKVGVVAQHVSKWRQKQ